MYREEKFIKEMASAMSEYRKRKNEYDRKLSDKREIQLAKINNVNLATLLLDKNKVRYYLRSSRYIQNTLESLNISTKSPISTPHSPKESSFCHCSAYLWGPKFALVLTTAGL